MNADHCIPFHTDVPSTGAAVLDAELDPARSRRSVPPVHRHRLVEVALGYLSRGWSVMAVPAASKKRIRKWHQFMHRLPTPEEVQRDFARERGTPNVAIITGAVSRLAVLDADSPEAVARVKALGLPNTLTVLTARPGLHVYLFTDIAIPSRKLGRLRLELRAEGSYIVAPGSVHPTGLKYRFEDPEAPLAPLPETVLEMFSISLEGQPAERLPQRWLDLVDTNTRVRTAWEGKGKHKDRSGSGRDMFLAHEIRRCGFSFEDARSILRAAPYPVDGGRSDQYLDLTLGKAYRASQKRQPSPYGQIPLELVDTEIWAELSPSAKALYVVLVAWRMRPSGKVVRSAENLAKKAGIHIDTLGVAAAALEQKGLVSNRHRVAGGRMEYTVPFVLPRDETGVRETQAEGRVPEPNLSPVLDRGKRESVSPVSDRGKTVIDHEMKKTPSVPPPSEVPPEQGEDGQGVAGAPPPLPSMCLIPELRPGGIKVVYRQLRNGGRVCVFRGGIAEWLAWTPPEILRYEDRIAEWLTVEDP